MEAGSKGLGRVGGACARHPILVIAIWLVLLVGTVLGHSYISGNYQNDVNLSGTQAFTGLSLLEQNSPASSGYSGLIVVTGPQVGLDAAAIRASISNLTGLKDVVGVSKPLLSKSGKAALLTVHLSVLPASLGRSYANHLYKAMTPATHAGLIVNYGGGFDPIVNPKTTDLGSELIGFAVALIVLIASFKSLIAAGLPLLTALFSVVIGVSILGMVSAIVTFGTDAPTLAIMIGLGVGIDYAVFLTTRFRQAIIDGMDPVAAQPLTLPGRAGEQSW